VGLPDAAVRESRERVRAAVENSGVPVSGAPHHSEPRSPRHELSDPLRPRRRDRERVGVRVTCSRTSSPRSRSAVARRSPPVGRASEVSHRASAHEQEPPKDSRATTSLDGALADEHQPMGRRPGERIRTASRAARRDTQQSLAKRGSPAPITVLSGEDQRAASRGPYPGERCSYADPGGPPLAPSLPLLSIAPPAVHAQRIVAILETPPGHPAPRGGRARQRHGESTPEDDRDAGTLADASPPEAAPLRAERSPVQIRSPRLTQTLHTASQGRARERDCGGALRRAPHPPRSTTLSTPILRRP
jgi:hypothetical protein